MPDIFNLDDHTTMVRISDDKEVGQVVFNRLFAEASLDAADGVSKRDINWRHVAHLADDMLHDRWSHGEEGCAYQRGKDGKPDMMHDGVQRCWAIIRADDERPGISIPMTVSRLENAAILRNVGLPRNNTHVFQVAKGRPNSSLFAKAAEVLWKLERGPAAITGSWKPTPQQALNTYEEWEAELMEAVAEIPSAGGQSFRHLCGGNVGWFAALDCILRRTNPEKARMFRRQVVAGEALEKGDPAYALRASLEKIAIDKANKTQVPRHRKKEWYKLALSIRAWNDHLSHKERAQLRQGANPDHFPEIQAWKKWRDVDWSAPKSGPVDQWVEKHGRAKKKKRTSGPPQPAMPDLASELRGKTDRGYVYPLDRLRKAAVANSIANQAVAATWGRSQVEKALLVSDLSVDDLRREVWGAV